MANFSFDDMQAIQKELQEKYFDKWGGLYPEKAVRMMLWMLCEAGEAAQVLKRSPPKTSSPTHPSESTLSKKCAT